MKQEGDMELSVFIAKITAVIYLSAALGGFLSRDYYRRLAEDIYKNAGLTYLTGFMAVIVGFLVVHYHNFWKPDWTVLITIIGWIALVKGVCLIVFPGFIKRLSESLSTTERALQLYPYVALLLGLLFGYFGFVRENV